MSCYNSEYGRITIPSAEIVPLRKRIVRTHNEAQEALRTRFNGLLDRMRQLLKNDVPLHDIGDRLGFNEDMWSLIRAKYNRETGYIKKCYKKDLDTKKLSAQRVTLTDEDLTVTIDTKSRTLIWRVSENNRAVERARRSALGKSTERALSRVKWTRNSGGVVKYQDEYQRDSFTGPTISARYGSQRA